MVSWSCQRGDWRKVQDAAGRKRKRMMLFDGGCVCGQAEGPQVRREKASLRGKRKWTQVNICLSVLMIASSGVCWTVYWSPANHNTILSFGDLPVFLVCDDPMTGSLPCDITDLKAQQQQSEHHLVRIITAAWILNIHRKLKNVTLVHLFSWQWGKRIHLNVKLWTECLLQWLGTSP